MCDAILVNLFYVAALPGDGIAINLSILLLITLDIVYYDIIVRKKFYKNLPVYTSRIHISVFAVPFI